MQFIDLQVNGYAGVDFNSDELSAAALHSACLQLKADRVATILATIITADFQVMLRRLRRLVNLREKNELVRTIIRGIHLEGPFLNPQDGFRGAHQKEYLHRANLPEMEQLLAAADGLISLVTLAPEMDVNFAVTRYLSNQDIIVAAGHCDADLPTLQQAVDAGLSMFTHLGNGCPQMLSRHDNIIARVLSLKDRLWLCFIADGIHIPFFALRNYLTIAGSEKSIIVTDAMAAAAAVPGKYTLGNLELEIGPDHIVREPGKENFAGSAVTMQQSAANLQQQLGCSREDVQKMLYNNPKNVLSISNRSGG